MDQIDQILPKHPLFYYERERNGPKLTKETNMDQNELNVILVWLNMSIITLNVTLQFLNITSRKLRDE